MNAALYLRISTRTDKRDDDDARQRKRQEVTLLERNTPRADQGQFVTCMSASVVAAWAVIAHFGEKRSSLPTLPGNSAAPVARTMSVEKASTLNFSAASTDDARLRSRVPDGAIIDAIHEEQIETFGGIHGVRDENAPESRSGCAECLSLRERGACLRLEPGGQISTWFQKFANVFAPQGAPTVRDFPEGRSDR